MKTYYSNGKLLITGEYLVLDGALALAVPTKYGQSLEVHDTQANNRFKWESKDHKHEVWYSNEFIFENGVLRSLKSDQTSKRLLNIFNVVFKLKPNLLEKSKGTHFKTQLDFPQNWGLGSSSTLINNIAQWANIDPYLLLERTFGGSGYDIACAQKESPITYCLSNGRTIRDVHFNPVFKSHLFFVHLNKKQDSRSGIAMYRQNKGELKHIITEINNITEHIISSSSLHEFESLLNSHEAIISKVLKMPTIKKVNFPDYRGLIKSLGAWGGDFIMATGNNESRQYFVDKGYHTIIDYEDLILDRN